MLHTTDFDHVFRTGQRSADGYFTVLFRSTDGEQPRLGFALSKKRVRLAVGRNRLRRLVRESFRRRAPGLPPLDVVVLARDAAGLAVNREIFASLDRHWTRLESVRLQSNRRADALPQGALPPTTT